jgi:endogenous inhibitor of DNA gyrase (YacG/DUF329 family)
VQKVERKCKACGGHFSPRPQNSDQQFCSKRECQRERKRRWQKHKRATDADYRENQARARQRWAQAHPDYWRRYRRDHSDYTARNRVLQRERDRRRREGLAKMDACRVQLTVLPEVSEECPILQRDDSMGTVAAC